MKSLKVVPPESNSAISVQSFRPKNGILTLSGYGIRVAVERGHLAVEDGIGSERRSGRFSRATAGFKRLVIIGHSGTISLDALRWLNDIRASIVQIDNDGNIIVAGGPSGLDDARLRRAQALAIVSGVGLDIAKSLIRQKLAGQADVLYGDFRESDASVTAIRLLRRRIDDAASVEELRQLEAQAASIYWSAWRDLPIPFVRKDAAKVPDIWLRFGSRRSPLSSPSPRRAGNPANALLNYVYAIVEAECRIAALAVGLDPAIGVMHSDLRARDSLACDLMEPVRPKADEFVLELLKRREFRKSDFFETRQGVCRILPPITKELAESSPRFAKVIGSIAEDVAQKIFRSAKLAMTRLQEPQVSRTETPQKDEALPTPLTQSNRSNGKERSRPPIRPLPPKRKLLRLPCLCCGKEIDGKHYSFCNACLEPV